MRTLSEQPFIERQWIEHGNSAGFTIHTNKVRWNRLRWDQMTSFEKRKFENMLVLENPKVRLQFKYL